MKNNILKIIIFILLLIIAYPFFSAPSKSDVVKIVKNEINNEINKNKKGQFISEFFSSIFKTINSASSFLFYSFIVFTIITLVFIITLIILRNISSSKYISQITNAIKEEHKENVFDEKYFEELLKNDDFSKAIIYLHRCTIFYLLKNKIIFNKNMTNYSLYTRIKDNSTKNAFKKIYIISEKILFDDYSANNNDLYFCKDLYFNNFLTDKI